MLRNNDALRLVTKILFSVPCEINRLNWEDEITAVNRRHGERSSRTYAELHDSHLNNNYRREG